MMSAPLRFGLVGTGHWARIAHAPALASTKGIELAAVWGRNPQAAAELAAAYHATPHEDLAAFLAGVDGVAFAVPPDVQAPIAVRAARAGKHLLLEKPIALSEADAGSDAASLRARAVRSGDGWVLNGAKAWVSNGGTADVILAMVRTDPEGAPRGARGIGCFIVPAGAAGLVAGKAEDKMGLRASNTAALFFQDLRLSEDQLLGDASSGFLYALEALDSGRLGIAAQACGIARAALEHATRYAAERRQFGRAIQDFEAIRFKLADMATRLAAARALLHEAARRKDAGERATRWAAMAKLFCSETAMWVATQAVQVFGGYGFMRDYPVERLMRDAKATEIYEGTSEIQRLVIGRELLNAH